MKDSDKEKASFIYSLGKYLFKNAIWSYKCVSNISKLVGTLFEDELNFVAAYIDVIAVYSHAMGQSYETSWTNIFLNYKMQG